jgi:adenine-specific DNA glycosylase
VKVRIAAAILRDPQGRVLLVRDPGAHDEVLFSRMWQFPAVEVAEHAAKELAAHLQKTLGLKSTPLQELPAARHGVTYRNIALLPFLAHVPALPKLARTRILNLERLGSVPVSSATRKIAAALAGVNRKVSTST